MAISKRIHQMTIGQFEAMFPDDDACKQYLVNTRWPDGVICCPRCDSEKVREVTAKPFHWQCRQCSTDGYRFSVLVGSIFENTKKPLRQWFRVIHMMLTSKKGVSSLQVYRVLGFGSYETALNMCNKIRTALMDSEFKKLIGVVEVDETYIGGKAKNRHKDKRGGPGGTGSAGGTGGHDKAILVGAVQRKGNVIARVINRVDSDTLAAFVRETVSDRVSLLATDEHKGYNKIGREYPHGVVQHSIGNYVHGAVHTNTIVGFWSLVKRGVIGTFHNVSAKYLPLYVAEFQFRYNNRLNENIFGAALAGC